MSKPYRDVVVFIPGILGSVLKRGEETLWGVSAHAAWNLLNGKTLEGLRLDEPDALDEDIGDGVTATGLVPYIEVIPHFWKIGGYSRIAQRLDTFPGLTRNENYFVFPYDWRRDNRVAANRLNKESHDWLKSWRAKSGNEDAKLIIIAHSMGGLVARYYVECLEGWTSTRTLFTMGTPFRGSGAAVDFLSNGLTYPLAPPPMKTAAAACRSFASIYQLLPQYPFVDLGNQQFAKVSDFQLPNIDLNRAGKAASFHQEMTDAYHQNRTIDAYAARSAPLRMLVGTQQETIESVILAGDGRVVGRQHDFMGETQLGDGTVPRVSGTPIGVDKAGETWRSNQHSLLVADDLAFNHMEEILRGTAIPEDQYRQRPSLAWIRLIVDDVYDSSGPVTVRANYELYKQSLTARITSNENPAATFELTLWLKDGTYVGERQLKAGSYSIWITTAGAEPAGDVFLVI